MEKLLFDSLPNVCGNLLCLFQGGMYVLNLYNWQSGGVSLLFLALFEVVTVAWGYGADRFAKDIETMIGYKIWPWWRIAWKFCTPFVILGRYQSACYIGYKHKPYNK